MIDLSDFFYSEQSEFDKNFHKLVPDRIVDRNRLTFVFFQTRAEDQKKNFITNQRDEYMAIRMEQLREVASLLDITAIEIPLQHYDTLSEQLTNYDIDPQQILFLAVTSLPVKLCWGINTLIHSGYRIIIGFCSSRITKNDLIIYPEHKPFMKNIKMVDTLEFVDILLWEEFNKEFRDARSATQILPCLRDIVLPCMRQLELGEPQLRLHWYEGVNGVYVREFALETDCELKESSRVKLVFRQPVEDKLKGFSDKPINKVYRYCTLALKDYICLQITSEYELGCCLTRISKDNKNNAYDILDESHRIRDELGNNAGDEFLAQNTESVLQIGTIPSHSNQEICQYRTLHSQELDVFHIRNAIRDSIKAIGDSDSRRYSPILDDRIQFLIERLYVQNKNKPKGGLTPHQP